MAENAKQWFLRIISRDIFVISAVTWIIMFFMEAFKTGVVSNYISLPHFALLVVFFGITALVFQPAMPAAIPGPLSSAEKRGLIVISLLLILLIPLIVEASKALTVLLVFVTVAALWLGTMVLREP